MPKLLLYLTGFTEVHVLMLTLLSIGPSCYAQLHFGASLLIIHLEILLYTASIKHLYVCYREAVNIDGIHGFQNGPMAACVFLPDHYL